MYPDTFEYFPAESVDHAVELSEEHADKDVEFLAGGHSLIPTMKSRLANPDVIIDLNGLDELADIEPNGDRTRIGALTRYVDVVNSESLSRDAAVIAEAAANIADVQVRNMGTVGGNIAHADPASDLPAAVLAAGATITAKGPDGERTIDADDFFVGIYETALEEEEVLTYVDVPHAGKSDRDTYIKKSHPASGYAAVGIAVRLRTDEGLITSARVAATGVLDHAIRLKEVEDVLVGAEVDDDDALKDAAKKASIGLDPDLVMEDMHFSSKSRLSLLEAYTRRALTSENVGD